MRKQLTATAAIVALIDMTPAGWAGYFGHSELAAWLKDKQRH